MKKLVSYIAIVCILISVPQSIVFAAAPNNNPVNTVVSFVNSIDQKKWDKLISLSTINDFAENEAFFANNNNKVNSIGYFDINNAQLMNYYPVSNEKLSNYFDMKKYYSLYPDGVTAYLVGINLNVKNETKYFTNKLNYFIMVLGIEKSQWKVIQFSQAPLDFIQQLVVNSSSTIPAGTDQAINIITNRYAGLYVDSKNQAIGSDRSSSVVGITPYSAGIGPEPISINVKITSNGQISKVAFTTYVQNVLPNEWYASWNAQALEAGAMFVKMYGWYWERNSKYPGLGYDVKDSTADQVYKPNTAQTSTNNAISCISRLMLTDSTATYIPLIQYDSGTQGSPNPLNKGRVSQWGTQYLATKGYSYDQIISYYVGSGNKYGNPVCYTTTIPG